MNVFGTFGFIFIVPDHTALTSARDIKGPS